MDEECIFHSSVEIESNHLHLKVSLVLPRTNNDHTGAASACCSSRKFSPRIGEVAVKTDLQVSIKHDSPAAQCSESRIYSMEIRIRAREIVTCHPNGQPERGQP